MEKNKNSKKFLWIYAAVLFLSAFAVLLLTAFSQVKLSNNMDEYKRKLSERDNSIKEFSINLNSAAEEKTLLKQKLKQLEDENNNLKGVTNELGDFSTVKQRIERCRKSFDLLLHADNCYKQEKYVSCAEALKEIFVEDLGDQGAKRYSYLKAKVYLFAVKDFYKRGKEQMVLKNYLKSKDYFEKSLSFDETRYYEENTLFYLAFLSNKLKDQDKLKQYTQILTEKYPKSEYIEKIKKYMEGVQAGN